MPVTIRNAFILVCLCVLAVLPAAGEKLEKGIAVPAELPAALKDAVEAEGVRVSKDSGEAMMEIWLNKALAASPAEASGDIAYPGVPEGSFLGVWRYVAQGSDFRGQRVKPGLYTMRYGLMPADGAHLGASPVRDFVLLLPVEADSDPAALLKFQQVVPLSRKASGTGHPATYPMLMPEAAGEPTVEANDHHQVFLKTSVKTKGGAAMPIVVTVAGRGE